MRRDRWFTILQGLHGFPTDPTKQRTLAYLFPGLGFPQRGEREECHWWPGPSLPTSFVSYIPHGKTGWEIHRSHGGSKSHTQMSLMPWRWLDDLVPLELQGPRVDIKTLLKCLEDAVAQRDLGEGQPAPHPPTCPLSPKCSSLELGLPDPHSFQFVFSKYLLLLFVSHFFFPFLLKEGVCTHHRRDTMRSVDESLEIEWEASLMWEQRAGGD